MMELELILKKLQLKIGSCLVMDHLVLLIVILKNLKLLPLLLDSYKPKLELKQLLKILLELKNKSMLLLLKFPEIKKIVELLISMIMEILNLKFSVKLQVNQNKYSLLLVF
jgi:hypothetical protein